MQQNEKPRHIKPRILNKLTIDSTLSYQKSRQKGYRVYPKLAVKFKDSSSCEKSLYSKTVRKIMLVKIFKKAKFIRNLDFSSFLVTDQNFYASKLRYIAKKLSNTLQLSLYDYRERQNGCRGHTATWPKYMKHLQSFLYHVFLELSHANYFNSRMYDSYQLYPPIKKLTLATDFLRYVTGLKALKVIYPHNEHTSYMDGIWEFKKYPPLIEKLGFCQATCSTNILKTSLKNFKQLKDLDIYFVYNADVMLMKSVIPLISQLSQLQILNVNLVDNFEIRPDTCEAIKKLVSLKKVKLQLSLEKFPSNLQILEALEGCPLKDLNLGVVMKHDEELSKITEFLNKKNSLESLRIRITRMDPLKNSDQLVKLIKAIDNLPQLTSLVFLHKMNGFWYPSLKQMLPAIDLSFGTLFSKPIPMKKFKIGLNQHTFSQEGYMNILETIKKTSSVIEKIRIDIGEYKPKTNAETDFLLEFMRSLTNIRSLKLIGLGVPSRQFFAELIDTVSVLKSLRVLSLGEVSGKVAKPSFVDGVEKVLLKFGLEKFNCETTAEFKKTLAKKSKACPDIDLEKIRKKNPFLKNGPAAPIYVIEEKEEAWQVKIPFRVKFGFDARR